MFGFNFSLGNNPVTAVGRRLSRGFARAGEVLTNLGTTPSKSLRTALLEGDEAKALEIYTSSKNGKSLEEDLHPSMPFPSKKTGGETPLHLATLMALHKLILIFIEKGGQPSSLNARQQTCLHSVCSRPDNPELRLEILELFLKWRSGKAACTNPPLGDKKDEIVTNEETDGAISSDQKEEMVSVNRVDVDGNAALHYASENGLSICVERLIQSGAILSLVNKAQKTCCELADENHNQDLASALELALVFQPEDAHMWEISNSLFGNLDEMSESAFIKESTSMILKQVGCFMKQTVKNVKAFIEEVEEQKERQRQEDRLSTSDSQSDASAAPEGGDPKNVDSATASRVHLKCLGFSNEKIEALLNAYRWDVSRLKEEWSTSPAHALAFAHLTCDIYPPPPAPTPSSSMTSTSSNRNNQATTMENPSTPSTSATTTAAKAADSTVGNRKASSTTSSSIKPSQDMNTKQTVAKSPLSSPSKLGATTGTSPVSSSPQSSNDSDDEDDEDIGDDVEAFVRVIPRLKGESAPSTPLASPSRKMVDNFSETEPGISDQQQKSGLVLMPPPPPSDFLPANVSPPPEDNLPAPPTITEAPLPPKPPSDCTPTESSIPDLLLQSEQAAPPPQNTSSSTAIDKSLSENLSDSLVSADASSVIEVGAIELIDEEKVVANAECRDNDTKESSLTTQEGLALTENKIDNIEERVEGSNRKEEATAALEVPISVETKVKVSENLSEMQIDASCKEPSIDKTKLISTSNVTMFELDICSVCEPSSSSTSSSSLSSSSSSSSTAPIATPPPTCSICGEDMEGSTLPSTLPPTPPISSTQCITCGAGHSFCFDCWTTHLRIQVGERKVSGLECPAYKCGEVLRNEWAAVLLPKNLICRLRRQRKLFVVSCCPTLRRCPTDGCSLIMHFSSDKSIPGLSSKEAPSDLMEEAGLTAVCDNGHAFCLKCGGQAHSPCSCYIWQRWLNKVAHETASLPSSTASPSSSTDLANALWVAANTKPCPKCRSLIEKDEGCNHMICATCRYEFCWICMKDWSLHSNRTGGYFQCNRFVMDVEEGRVEAPTGRSGGRRGRDGASIEELGSARMESYRTKQKALRVARFIHHLTRYQAHKDSAAMEARMYKESITRLYTSLQSAALGGLRWLQPTIPNPISSIPSSSSPGALTSPPPSAPTFVLQRHEKAIRKQKKQAALASSSSSSSSSTSASPLVHQRAASENLTAASPSPSPSTPQRSSFSSFTSSSSPSTFKISRALFSGGKGDEKNKKGGKDGSKEGGADAESGAINDNDDGGEEEGEDDEMEGNDETEGYYDESESPAEKKSNHTSASTIDNAKPNPNLGEAPASSSTSLSSPASLNTTVPVPTPQLPLNPLAFLEEGFRELLRCRYFLSGSYVYMFYAFGDEDDINVPSSSSSSTSPSHALLKRRLPPSRQHAFERLQATLETCVEILSDALARRRLRAARSQIEAITMAARVNRAELESWIYAHSYSAAAASSSSSSSSSSSMSPSSSLLSSLGGGHHGTRRGLRNHRTERAGRADRGARRFHRLHDWIREEGLLGDEDEDDDEISIVAFLSELEAQARWGEGGGRDVRGGGGRRDEMTADSRQHEGGDDEEVWGDYNEDMDIMNGRREGSEEGRMEETREGDDNSQNAQTPPTSATPSSSSSNRRRGQSTPSSGALPLPSSALHALNAEYDAFTAQAMEQADLNRAILMSLRDSLSPAQSPAQNTSQIQDSASSSDSTTSAVSNISDVESPPSSLLSTQGQSDSQSQSQLQPTAQSSLEMLVSMGFPSEQSRQALAQAGGDVEGAVNILLSLGL